MKYVVVLLLFSSAAHASVDFSQYDKKVHVTYAAMGTLVSSQMLKGHVDQPQAAAVLIMLTAGVVKEMCDSRFDGEDMQADAIGILGGVALSYTINL